MVILDPKNGVRFGMCKTLDDFYREIGRDCRCFDIARRSVGGKTFDIFVDDEGLLKDGYEELFSAIAMEDGKLAPQLVGTLIFANHDEEGHTTDLSLEDTLLISSRIRPIRAISRETEETFTNYCVMLDPVVKTNACDFTI